MTHENPAALSRIVHTDEMPVPADYEAWFVFGAACWEEELRDLVGRVPQGDSG